MVLQSRCYKYFPFQAIEQDRHVLRRKLHSKESELDARNIELQNDIIELQTKLQAKENLLKQWEKEKTSLVAELRAQNSRLTQQLKDTAVGEQKLRVEVDSYREQIALGRNNLQVSVEIFRTIWLRINSFVYTTLFCIISF